MWGESCSTAGGLWQTESTFGDELPPGHSPLVGKFLSSVTRLCVVFSLLSPVYSYSTVLTKSHDLVAVTELPWLLLPGYLKFDGH